MKALFRILLAALIVNLAFVAYLVVRSSRSRREILAHEVGADSIAVYQTRADSLAVHAESLEVRFEKAGILAKPEVLRQLTALEDEIDALRIAIDKWRSARGKYGQGQAYQKCILLYGRASGICDVLQEAEPPPTDPE